MAHMEMNSDTNVQRFAIRRRLFQACALASLIAGTHPVLAQVPIAANQAPAADDADVGEIIVTARKRRETALDVPVPLVALGKAVLAEYSTNDLTALAGRVPGLIISTSAQGANIALRGISTTPANAAGDQAVSFNIDGVQVSNGNIVRLATIDLQQVEVLKGPQALFFGKNSPGGIVSLRTVDPGNSFEATAIGGYEFNARERSIQITMGGPLTETLGIRVVGYAMGMTGYRRNRARAAFDATGNQVAFAPNHVRGPRSNEKMLRGTLFYKPTSDLSIRGKWTFGRFRNHEDWQSQDRIACPNGAPQVGPGGVGAQQDDCRANNTYYLGATDPRQTVRYPQFFNYIGQRTKQNLGTLEVNYNLAPDISLTSVSGIYLLEDGYSGHATSQPASLVISSNLFKRNEKSQEIRLATAREDWPVNFTAGGFYQKIDYKQRTTIFINIPVGTANFNGPSSYAQYFVDTKAYSLFGQAIWKITPTIELGAGVRWSREKKDVNVIYGQQRVGGAPTDFAYQNLLLTPSQARFTDTSPEVTLKWKPSPDLMVFGAFRNGFKSGGFSTAAGTGPNPAGVNLFYKPEDVRGFDLGLKYARRGLRANLTGYRYTYKGLQVSTFDPVLIQQRVVNAANARIWGIETDFSYHPPSIDGLELRGSLNYNHARYTNFLVGCYTGETVAMGCNQNLNPATGAFRQQNFKGKSLSLAPDWTGIAGFQYDMTLGGLNLSLGGEANYSSSFFAELEQNPFGKQKSYWMFNANVRLASEDKRWEMALIGQNLTEVFRSRFVSSATLSGVSARTGTNTPGGLSDLTGVLNRGRQVRLQLTVNLN